MGDSGSPDDFAPSRATGASPHIVRAQVWKLAGGVERRKQDRLAVALADEFAREGSRVEERAVASAAQDLAQVGASAFAADRGSRVERASVREGTPTGVEQGQGDRGVDHRASLRGAQRWQLQLRPCTGCTRGMRGTVTVTERLLEILTIFMRSPP